jgi:hypothetical protein
MWDAPQGYHQICVAKTSQEKLAFASPDTTKWTYNVMPFGSVNGPSTFIAFIHDMNGTWQDLACSLNLIIDDDLNTTIIVNDIVSWAKNLIMALVFYGISAPRLPISKSIPQSDEIAYLCQTV